MEGYLFEFKNIKNLNTDREIKCLGVDEYAKKYVSFLQRTNRNVSIANKKA